MFLGSGKQHVGSELLKQHSPIFLGGPAYDTKAIACTSQAIQQVSLSRWWVPGAHNMPTSRTQKTGPGRSGIVPMVWLKGTGNDHIPSSESRGYFLMPHLYPRSNGP